MSLLRRVIGAVLRRERQRQGRTLREVARAAGVSVPYLSEVERGRKEASSEVLAAICRALGLYLSDLLEEVRDELRRVERRLPTAPPSSYVPATRHVGPAVPSAGPGTGGPPQPVAHVGGVGFGTTPVATGWLGNNGRIGSELAGSGLLGGELTGSGRAGGELAGGSLAGGGLAGGGSAVGARRGGGAGLGGGLVGGLRVVVFGEVGADPTGHPDATARGALLRSGSLLRATPAGRPGGSALRRARARMRSAAAGARWTRTLTRPHQDGPSGHDPRRGHRPAGRAVAGTIRTVTPSSRTSANR